jgi:hypothetical protein
MFQTNLGVDEPTVVELVNGSLYCLLRTTFIQSLSGSTHVSAMSNDYGKTWSVCKRVENMYSYDTTPALFRYSWTPNIILVAWINRTADVFNDITAIYNRRPLVASYSDDDCLTWKEPTVIDDGLGMSINEPNFAVISGAVLLGYRRYGATSVVSDALLRIFALDLPKSTVGYQDPNTSAQCNGPYYAFDGTVYWIVALEGKRPTRLISDYT